jgi:HTH-type transcriptional regulator/antitoxin HigA
MREVRPLCTEADYNAALEAIEEYFTEEPQPGSAEADRFDLRALVIGDYERKHWAIEAPDLLRAQMEQKRVAAVRPR